MRSLSVSRVLGFLFVGQLFAQITETGAAVKDIDVLVDADFNAGGIASVTQVF